MQSWTRQCASGDFAHYWSPSVLLRVLMQSWARQCASGDFAHYRPRSVLLRVLMQSWARSLVPNGPHSILVELVELWTWAPVEHLG